MSRKTKKQNHSLKPYISITLIVATLFVTVAFKMESRRLGYQAVKLNSELESVRSEYRSEAMKLAQSVRADRIKFYAMSQLTLAQAQKGQIIQMSGDNIALAY